MKYLKGINEAINRIVTECSEEEYYKKISMHGFCTFEEKEIDYISNFINSSGWTSFSLHTLKNVIQPKGRCITLQKRLSTNQGYKDLKIILTKLNDKWYTIESRNYYGSQTFSKFYICDEFIEVKNYLELVKNEN